MSTRQENLKTCDTCYHRCCCAEPFKIQQAWAKIQQGMGLDNHKFSLQIKCVDFIDIGFVENAIEAYKNQNKQEEK